MLCSDEVTYTISDLALEYDIIIDAGYIFSVFQSPAREFIPLHKGDKLSYKPYSEKRTALLIRYKACRQESYKDHYKDLNSRIKQNLHTRWKVFTTLQSRR